MSPYSVTDSSEIKIFHLTGRSLNRRVNNSKKLKNSLKQTRFTKPLPARISSAQLPCRPSDKWRGKEDSQENSFLEEAEAS